MRKTLLIASLTIASVASAQLFQSGFEDWTGSAPDDWMGSKTTVPAASVEQVSENAHGGDYAVRLTNASSSHQRFTTQTLTVANGVSYEVSFWIRGGGDIRVGLFDDRSGNGYATYSGYTSAGSAWTQVTQTITAANGTGNAEFILSVRNTTAPEHMVVDDVTITEAGAPETKSIYDIQFTTDASGNSPYDGQTVITGGVVSGILPAANAGYFVQSGSGPWSGIYVYDLDNEPAIGDSITFTASVSEYFGLTELSGLANYTVVSSGNPIAAFDVETGDVSLEPLESVLVRVVGATCTEVPGGANFGKYKLDDGTGDCVIGKVIYTTTPDPQLGDVMTVTGVNYYNFEEYNIQPRFQDDVDFGSGIAEEGAWSTLSVGPNPAHDLLHIDLGQVAGNVVYTLTDTQGRTVQSGEISNARTQLGVGGLTTGLYHLTLRTNKLVKTFAVQVAH